MERNKEIEYRPCRGTKEQMFKNQSSFLKRELLYCTDTEELLISNGTDGPPTLIGKSPYSSFSIGRWAFPEVSLWKSLKKWFKERNVKL